MAMGPRRRSRGIPKAFQRYAGHFIEKDYEVLEDTQTIL